MHMTRCVLVIVLTVLFAACASHAPQKVVSGYKVGNPYRINGVWYTPRIQPNYNEVGVASWYGPGFHGKYTANGERYDQNALTAAHTTLPMPTNVRVTNLENGRSLVVRVNDRGPFARSRIIDLSSRAADLLGFKQQGTARVRVEVIGPAQGDAPFTMQAKEVPAPSRAGQAPAQVASAEPRSGAPPAAAGTTSTTLRQTTATTLAPAAMITAAAAPESALLRSSYGAGKLYVQVGAFSDSDNAIAAYNEVLPLGKAVISPYEMEGKRLYRVRLGPVADHDEAVRLTANLRASGHDGAQIVVE